MKGLWDRLSRIFKPIPGQIGDHPFLYGGESSFLAGAHSRWNETLRVVRIAIEFIRGFRAFHFLGPAVTVFGSARFHDGHPHYELARQTAKLLAEEGYVIVTGGGPGIMEAANRGAQEGKSLSVGANVILPMEQRHNQYLDKFVTFYYFFVRKVILVKYSVAFVVLPGGFGTLDEFFEALTLIQTGKLYRFPVILMGTTYWKGLVDWIEGTLIPNGTIAPEDLKYLTLTDDPQVALDAIAKTTLDLKIPFTPRPRKPKTTQG